jgi:hypothetical protein
LETVTVNKTLFNRAAALMGILALVAGASLATNGPIGQKTIAAEKPRESAAAGEKPRPATANGELVAGNFVRANEPESPKKKGGGPTVVVQFASPKRATEVLRILLRTTGHETLLDRMLAGMKAEPGGESFFGINGDKPWGFYAEPTDDETSLRAVLMVPVGDETRLLREIDRHCTTEKLADGRFKARRPDWPRPAYFRLNKEHAYLSLDENDKLSPDSLLPGKEVFDESNKAALRASLRLDRLPKLFERLLIGSLAQAGAMTKRLLSENGGKAQQDYTVKVLDLLVDGLEVLLTQGRELSFSADVNDASREVTAEIRFDGKEGSTLAQNLAVLGREKSLFGEWAEPDSPFSLLVHLRVPEALSQGWATGVREASRMALGEIKDQSTREEFERLLRVIGPTFTAGELDFALLSTGNGTGQPATVNIGLKLANGKDALKSFQEQAALITAEHRKSLGLTEVRAAGRDVFRFDVADQFPDRFRRFFGANPFYLGFRDDAAFATGGVGGLVFLKNDFAIKPQQAPLFQLKTNVRDLIDLFPLPPAAQEAAREALRDQPGRVRLTAEGGEALRVRLTFDLALVRFAAMAEPIRFEIQIPVPKP